MPRLVLERTILGGFMKAISIYYLRRSLLFVVIGGLCFLRSLGCDYDIANDVLSVMTKSEDHQVFSGLTASVAMSFVFILCNFISFVVEIFIFYLKKSFKTSLNQDNPPKGADQDA